MFFLLLFGVVKILIFLACFSEAGDLCAHSPIPEEHVAFEDESQETDSDETDGSAPGQAEVENEVDDLGKAIIKCIFDPGSLSLNLSSSQTRHNFGQTSPQIPTHE